MHLIEAHAFFIHSPSIPMTIKDINGTHQPHSGYVRPQPQPQPPSDLTTMDPGHQAILEMHENSEASALFYVGVVLALYVLALVAVLSKYRRSERYESRLTRLYDDFLRRDRYLHRIPKRIATTELPVMTTTMTTDESAKDKDQMTKKLDFVVKVNEECNV